MSEEEGKVPYHHRHQQEQQQQQQQTQYGTFQGVANYPPPQPVIGFPQPIPPPGGADAPPPGYYAHGYQAVPGYAVTEGRPVRERRLPCCGFGFAWFLFIIGFFLAAIPCYVGAIILLCVRSVDHREKPGYIACTVAGSPCMMSLKMVEGAMAVIGLIAIILLRHASPRVAPYVEYAGFLSLAISFFAITTMFLPFTWIICPAVLLLHAFVVAFFKLRSSITDERKKKEKKKRRRRTEATKNSTETKGEEEERNRSLPRLSIVCFWRSSSTRDRRVRVSDRLFNQFDSSIS